MPDRPRRGARRALVCVLALLLGAPLAEVANRVRLRLAGTPYDRERFVAALRSAAGVPIEAQPRAEGETDATNVRILNPYWGVERELLAHGLLDHYATDPPPRVVEVLILGGSVAELFAVHAPRAIEASIRADPRFAGRPVAILNGAHHTYKQPQQAGKLAYLLARGWRPELVIELDGFNEVAMGAENARHGTDPLYPHLSSWGVATRNAGVWTPEQHVLLGEAARLRGEARELTERAARLGWSSLLAGWCARGVEDRNARTAAIEAELRQPVLAGGGSAWDQVHGPRPPATDDLALRLAVTGWAESSLSMAAMCRARGLAYVHVLQPALWDEGSKPLDASERLLCDAEHGWKAAVRAGYPRLRERGAQLAEREVAFVDASRVFAGRDLPLYYDHSHFGPRGCAILWETIAPDVLDALARALAAQPPANPPR